MARVANCPQCDHEFLVPNEADGESWAKCPECRAFFQLKQLTSRELPAALLVESSEMQAGRAEPQDAPAVTPYEDPTAALEAAAGISDQFATTLIGQNTDDHTAATENAGPGPDNLISAPQKSDDLEAAAQRIDEWFRSAKTVPDAPQIGADAIPAVEEVTDSRPDSAGPSRTNATLDIDGDDTNDLAAMADFDLDEPEGDLSSMKTIAETPAWDDTAELDDLLGDAAAPPAEEFVAEFAEADDSHADELDFAQDEAAVDAGTSAGSEERPSINLFADDDSSKNERTKRRARRRERSFARSLIMIVVAGVFGLAGGYYALLWLRGPSIDFLNVADFLPKAILPGSFETPKPVLRSAPPTIPSETVADAEPAQALPQGTEGTAAPMPDATATMEAIPAAGADQTKELQTGYTEEEPAPAVGDRYASAAGDDGAAANESSATGVTTEKPATADLTVDDLAPVESSTTDATAPATAEPASADSTAAQSPANEPATFEIPTAARLSEAVDANAETAVAEIQIGNAPAFTGDDLRASIEAATIAQPQLVAGNFADSKEVAQAKGRSYAILADLAQKTMFADVSEQTSKALAEQAGELFLKTLADAHTRGEVSQILPRWIQSPSRKHGGVFFGGKVVSHTAAGSVVECKVELDGGKTLTVLAPAGAELADSTEPVAIVGWIVDAPTNQIAGYTGTTKSPAIWTKNLIPLE